MKQLKLTKTMESNHLSTGQVQYLLDLAMKLTRSGYTTFLSYSGHVELVEVNIYPGLWDSYQENIYDFDEEPVNKRFSFYLGNDNTLEKYTKAVAFLEDMLLSPTNYITDGLFNDLLPKQSAGAEAKTVA